ncbi:MAG: hypothetical protein WBR10_17345 [Candidatus Acidiferrum sp.]
MSAATRSSRAIFLILILCLMGSTATYPQSAASFPAIKTPSNRTSSGAWLAKCEAPPMNLLAAGHLNNGGELAAIAGGISNDSNVPGAPQEVCLEVARSATLRTTLDNPCRQNAAAGSGAPAAFACGESADTIPAELTALGKAGLKIARAREGVLDILHSQNACTEWFETKDTNPAATFQSLSFLLDQHGPQDIFESLQVESIVIMRQPYVARATQDGGAHSTITINAHGAFFRLQGQVQKLAREGGPRELDGSRLLTVGSYSGDKLPARIVTLLHEFGHIIDLLPEDADNLDGKSARNTDEVLRHCRAEVEARSQQAKQTAKR